ncbi:hypothetical protein BD560DRAFT_131936 [Blakeslea trispora]|nr:hypothetical protein BD560DRAFT_131936 [Blakeslea trispora]
MKQSSSEKETSSKILVCLKDISRLKKKLFQNRDVCDACGGVGQFLCCDACPSAFHFTCVEPPMDSVDVANLKEKWFCNHCEHKHKRTRSYPRGLFSPLLDDLAQKNPKSFRLPLELTQFYKGVTADKYGRYVDTAQYKRTKSLDSTDLLKNKHGLILCYYCRKTSLKKQMIACDYCHLYWHLDCLNPPLAASPPLTKKWRCPHHIENFIKPRRQLRNPTDVTIITHDSTPACAYQNYIDNVLDGEGSSESEEVTTVDDKEEEQQEAEDLIVSQEGIAYRLPAKSIQLDLNQVLIPSEVETWLHNLACFKAGTSVHDQMGMYIHDTKQAISPKREMDLETYERYRAIEQLLNEKSKQELDDL